MPACPSTRVKSKSLSSSSVKPCASSIRVIRRSVAPEERFGNVEAVTTSDLIEPTRKAMQQLQQGPLAGYMPYTRQTEGVLRLLADLKPELLAVMHGSSYSGQGDKLLIDLAGVIKESFDQG